MVCLYIRTTKTGSLAAQHMNLISKASNDLLRIGCNITSFVPDINASIVIHT